MKKIIKSFILNLKHKLISKFYYPLAKFKIFLNKVNNFNLLLELYFKVHLEKIQKKNLKEKNKKKIFLIISDINYGGAEQQIIRLAYFLKKKKYNVNLISLCVNKKKSKKIFKNFCNQYQSKIKILFIENKFNKFNQNDYPQIEKIKFFSNRENFFYANLINLVIKDKPFIIHSYLDGNNAIAGLVGYIFNIKTVLSFRNTIPINFVWSRNYYKSIYRFLSKKKNVFFVSNSKNNSIDYQKWIGLKNKKIQITNNIFEFKKNKSKITKNLRNKIICTTINRLDLEKNIFYLIETFKYLNTEKKNIFLNIYGDGPLKNKVLKKIEFLKLSKNIRLHNPQKNISKILKNTDIFFLFSDYEGVPNVLLEAQSYGIPIIAKKVGGIPECIQENYSGYFLKYNSIKENSEYILNLLKKKKFIKKRNLNKIKNNLTKFNPKNAVNDVIKVYEK